MSHGIKKETYVKADAKTTKALTFDLLDKLYELAADAKEIHIEHMKPCEERFKSLENRKKKDTAIASVSGFGGGFLAVAAHTVKQWFTG